MHHLPLCLVAVKLPKDLVIPKPVLRARNLLAAGRETADSSRDRTALRNDNLFGSLELLHSLLLAPYLRATTRAYNGEDGEAQLTTAGCVPAAGDGCNFAAQARDYADACANGPCGRMSPARHEASGACAVELPVLPARTPFCHPAEFFDCAAASGCCPGRVELIGYRDLRSTRFWQRRGLIA
jgi:hypothetical protein